MFDNADIQAAVDANILTDAQAQRFAHWLRTREDAESKGRGTAMADDGNEALRFITNLNDVFITMGLSIFLFGSLTLTGVAISGLFTILPALGTLIIALFGACISWGLAEYFCQKRRMLLPGMLLAAVFVTCGMFLGSAFIASIRGVGAPELDFGFINTAKEIGYVGLFSALAANIGFFYRFRLPFCFAIFGVIGLALIYLIMFDQAPDTLYETYFIGLIIGGIASLAGAIWFDTKDPERVSRASDHAFWLHLVGAPQIIYGMSGLLDWLDFGRETVLGAIVMLIVLAALTILALVQNRRALVVASLISLAAAVGTILASTNADLEVTIALSATLVGGVVILIGGGWHTARRAVRKVLGLAAR